MWAELVESIQASSVRAMSLYGNILQHFGKNEIEKSLIVSYFGGVIFATNWKSEAKWAKSFLCNLPL